MHHHQEAKWIENTPLSIQQVQSASEETINTDRHEPIVVDEAKDTTSDGKYRKSLMDSIYESKFGYWFIQLSKCMKMFGRLMVLLSVTGLVYTYYFYFFITLPMMNTQTWTYLFHLILGIYIMIAISFYYAKAVLTNPGNTPQDWIYSCNIDDFKSDANAGKGKTKWCSRCQQPKPPRVHHCHICQQCVLRMDHHCPWLNNCVGLHNHKYFLGFTFFLALAADWNIFMISFGLIGIYEPEPVLYEAWSGWLMFNLVLCVVTGIALSFLTALHFYLIITNQTTIEFQFGKLNHMIDKKLKSTPYVNQFEVDVKTNIQQVLGKAANPNSYWELAALLLLINTKKPPCDGLNYPTTQHQKDDVV